MFKFTAFKTQKPREFKYRPRYYDPEKEAREERRKELRLMRGLPDEPSVGVENKGYIPGQYIESRRSHRVATQRQTSSTGAKLKLLMLIGAVAVLLYWIFFV